MKKLMLLLVMCTGALSITKAQAAPYLPSQGFLTVEKDCPGTTLTAGQKINIAADQNEVTIEYRGQTVSINNNSASGGRYCGMHDANDLCGIQSHPILRHGELIYNGYSTAGLMGTGAPLPIGFLVDPRRSPLYNLQLFDSGNGLVLSGITFLANGSTDPTDPNSQAVHVSNCLLENTND